ncbi:hypothetical protein N7533_011023 [Penicillium manginii]|uniref:uncharacterized protein n=1 Tax=Penicillium manginii TaxID=203109 RepID=UPI0025490A06|nr:uncharacterized protein N7533_011023 [Penicillium manginii]KAJ5741614.1 hypothetical protein N7533_011023 [Penicillium manginii]
MATDSFPSEMITVYKTFFLTFYSAVDSMDDEAVAGSFTESGTFVLGTKKATGILALLASLRRLVKSRTHHLDQFFIRSDSESVMMNGSVGYGQYDGSIVATEWAGLAHLMRVREDTVRMDNYQVYFASDATF